ADLRRERGGPGARVLGNDVAVREGLVVEVAAVVVADLLALAVDQHLDPVAPVAGGLHRGAEGDDALAVLGVVAVADPAAVGAHVAAEVTFRGRGPDGRGGGAGGERQQQGSDSHVLLLVGVAAGPAAVRGVGGRAATRW